MDHANKIITENMRRPWRDLPRQKVRQQLPQLPFLRSRRGTALRDGKSPILFMAALEMPPYPPPLA